MSRLCSALSPCATAAKALLGGTFWVTEHCGELIEHDTLEGTLRLLPTVHPSSVLRAPDDLRAEVRGGRSAPRLDRPVRAGPRPSPC